MLGRGRCCSTAQLSLLGAMSACCRHAATRLAVQAAEVLQKASGGRVGVEGDAWNQSSMDLIRLAKVGVPSMCLPSALLLHLPVPAQLGTGSICFTWLEICSQVPCPASWHPAATLSTSHPPTHTPTPILLSDLAAAPTPTPRRCVQAHCVLVLHQTFVEAVGAAGRERAVSAATAGVLGQLAALHGVVLLNECSADLLEGGYCTGGWWTRAGAQGRGIIIWEGVGGGCMVRQAGLGDFGSL